LKGIFSVFLIKNHAVWPTWDWRYSYVFVSYSYSYTYTYILVGGESVSITFRPLYHCPYWMRGWVCPRTVLDNLRKKIIIYICPLGNYYTVLYQFILMYVYAYIENPGEDAISCSVIRSGK